MAVEKSSNSAPVGLAIALVSVWFVIVGFHFYMIATGQLTWPPFSVARLDTSADFPQVTGLIPESQRYAPDLSVGDEIVSIGGASARGLGPLRMAVTVITGRHVGETVAITYRRNSDKQLYSSEIELPPTTYPWWRGVALVLGFFLPAGLLVLRDPMARMRRYYFLGSLMYVLVWTRVYGASAAVTYFGLGVFGVAATLAWPLIIRGTLLFPEENPGASRWHNVWPWGFAAMGPLALSALYGFPFSVGFGMRAVCVLGAVFCFMVLLILGLTYLSSDVIARRRIKWVLYSFYFGIVPELVAAGLAVASTQYFWLAEWMVSATAIAPIGVLIGIVRYNLFDIDNVISVTATYSVISFCAIGTIFYLAPQVAGYLTDSTGIPLQYGQLLVSVLFAGAWLSTRSKIQTWINRMFFPERHLVEGVVTEALSRLRDTSDIGEIFAYGGDALKRIANSGTVIIYRRSSGAFVNRYHSEGEPRDTIDTEDPLYGVLVSVTCNVVRKMVDDVPVESITPLQVAALDTLGVEILVPSIGDAGITGFVGVGKKGSGDIYTPTDLRWIETINGQIASEIGRLSAIEERQAVEQERDAAVGMQKEISRYVPEALTTQLERGQDMEMVEYKTSVLFVDMRAYSAFAEKIPTGSAFARISDYVSTVTEIVRRRGGHIMQFYGDGLLIIFGGPFEKESMEERALQAAKEIVVELLPAGEHAGTSGNGADGVRVGIGVATGQVTVGTVDMRDSGSTWALTGNTVNLASRLQELTKERDCTILTDDKTWGAGKAAALGFEKIEGVSIRGMSEARDLYLMRANS
jgi:class 3 adenylate cyclase